MKGMQRQICRRFWVSGFGGWADVGWRGGCTGWDVRARARRQRRRRRRRRRACARSQPAPLAHSGPRGRSSSSSSSSSSACACAPRVGSSACGRRARARAQAGGRAGRRASAGQNPLVVRPRAHLVVKLARLARVGRRRAHGCCVRRRLLCMWSGARPPRPGCAARARRSTRMGATEARETGGRLSPALLRSAS